MKRILFFSIFLMVGVAAYTYLFPFAYRWIPAKWWTEKMAYAQIKNLHSPSEADYQRLQKYLSSGRRPILQRLGDMKKRVRGFRLIGKGRDQLPFMGKVTVNCGDDDKENCLLVYASYNKAFSRGLKRLVEHVCKSDFRGHILYRVGGWPNAEAGDLTLAHVPYAFKPCFFREAQRLGYKKVLWLDTSILPLVSLNQIFSEIQAKGYFIMGNSHTVGPFMNEKAAQAHGVTMDECQRIPSCSAGIVGVNFSHEKAVLAIQEWYAAARDPDAFFSARSDQNSLSIILYKFGLREMKPIYTLVEKNQERSPDALFSIDRGWVHKW